EKPHVTRWWPDPERALPAIAGHLGEPTIERFILTIDGRDAGDLLVYGPHHGPTTDARKQVSTPTATSHAERVALTSSLAGPPSSDEVTDLPSFRASSTLPFKGPIRAKITNQ